MVRRCRQFSQCVLCKLCENYDRYRTECQVCESRKVPRQMCICPPKAKAAAILIQEKMRAALFDPNQAKGTVRSADVSRMKDWETIAQNLQLTPET